MNDAWMTIMNGEPDRSQVEQVRQQLRTALAEPLSESARVAMHASLRLLEALIDATKTDRTPRLEVGRYPGSIEYTIEDEEYEPFGRAFDVRIYYGWRDYDPADDPHAAWGAFIEDVELLAVRYFDADGLEVSAETHFSAAAERLLSRFERDVTEACTADGYRRGVGRAPATYAPGGGRGRIGTSALTTFEPRLAPSMPTRAAAAASQRRKWG